MFIERSSVNILQAASGKMTYLIAVVFPFMALL
jgi:hypothetical protein